MTEFQAMSLFLIERDKFAKHFPWCARARFVVHNRVYSPGGKVWRDMAWADTNDMTVNFVVRLLSLDPGRILGVMDHELGHLADKFCALPGAERRADAIARLVTGQTILYDEAEVQNLFRGQNFRPEHLHQ